MKWNKFVDSGILGTKTTKSAGGKAGENTGYVLRMDVPGDIPCFQLGNGNKTVFIYPRSFSLKFGKFYHLVGTFDGKEAKLYVNGEMVASRKLENFSICYGDIPAPLTLGYARYLSYFDGVIDRVRIYSKALTSEAIKSRYLKEKEEIKDAGEKPPLVKAKSDFPPITRHGKTYLYQPRYKEKDSPLTRITDEEKEKGYILYQRSNPRDVYPVSIPEREEIKNRIFLFATPGEYESTWFTIYP